MQFLKHDKKTGIDIFIDYVILDCGHSMIFESDAQRLEELKKREKEACSECAKTREVETADIERFIARRIKLAQKDSNA